MSNQLLPCPFCGCNAKLSETEGCDWVVSCTGCDAWFHDDMKWDIEDYDAKKNVIDKWNRRVNPKQKES